MNGKDTLPKPSGKARLPKEEVSRFKLHGVELKGSFKVYFTGEEWTLDKFSFQETKISGSDAQKLAQASKEDSAVPLEYGNGKGKANIISLHYDPKGAMLTHISLKLLEWSFE